MLRNYQSLSEKKKRKWQIDTLKIFNDRVIELKENLEYRVEFTAGNQNMSLDIQLGEDFPNEKPTLVISPVISHSWVVDDKIVGAPGLLNFTVHSDLGRVVHAIIREFERNPPAFTSSSPNNDANPFMAIAPMLDGQNPNGLYSPSTPSTASNQVPVAVSLQFPQLNDLSIEELHDLLVNEDLQDEFINALPETMSFNQTLQELRANVEELANENLAKQHNIETLRASVDNDISSALRLEMRITQLNDSLEKLSKPFSITAIKELLNINAVDADQEAEKISEEFLNGLIPVDIFVARYTEKRSLAHIRRAKYERLAHITE